MIEQEGIKIQTKFLDEDGEIMLIQLGGYIDQANVHLLQSTINDCIQSKSYKLIFNLENLVYMSSAGWGVLIGEIKRFREQGGDIKLVNMGPSVYEIYRMLEFYHILFEYPTLADAARSFGKDVNMKDISGITDRKDSAEKITANDPTLNNTEFLNPEQNDLPGEGLGSEFELEIQNILKEDLTKTPKNGGFVEFIPSNIEKAPELKFLPLSEKIKTIVGRFPHFGIWKIRKMLRHAEFGNEKVGYFKIRSMLKKLELDTPEKRYRYYRSC